MSEHAWWWFFGGSLLDALIGPNLVVPGEPFLLAAGYLLASGALYGVIAVFMGGFIGDQLSYFIGCKYGGQGRRWLGRRIKKTRRPIAKTRLILKKRGPWFIALARLLGPVAWIMPFLAGSYAVPWHIFTFYSAIGLAAGIGQFVLIGFLVGKGIHLLPSWDTVLLFLQEHSVLLIAITLATIACATLYRLDARKKWFSMSVCWLISLGAANYYHFFHSNAYSIEWISSANASATNTEQLVSLETLDYKIYPGLAPVYKPQPINVVIIGEHPSILMAEQGWIENKTFSKDDLNLKQYLALMTDELPPISDLYWAQQPQLLAYQHKGDIVQRRHIRWWYAGKEQSTSKEIWMGSVSYDNDLKLAHYKGMITVLHAIDPDIDQERDRIIEAIDNTKWSASYRRLGDPKAYSKSNHYFTDGQVLVLEKQPS
ncbi:LssY C-terminal domain-containing protein [Photobacterium makurazakiensis]|uniref:LssY C-terminal domain-containing protein n=1 Tax=Photobacterium makurazakiensis TaxID=2910234 RepID=UPI003D0DA061